jgi:4'-phosphopantetheinyl transferase
MMKIQRNEVHLWFVYDQEVTDAGLLQSYQGLLNASETQRWQRFKFPQHRQQFLVTRALVRSVLAEYLGENDPTKLVFDKNRFGKPFLVCPDATSSLNFNLSHTDGLIVLAVTTKNELGVDVETVTRKVEILKLAERYFSTQEIDDLNALKPSQHNKRFFDLWTLKESYIKACGKGLAIPLSDFSLSFNETISISFSPKLNDIPERWQFWQFDVDKDHRLALAVRADDRERYNLVCKTGVPLMNFEAYSPPLNVSNY